MKERCLFGLEVVCFCILLLAVCVDLKKRVINWQQRNLLPYEFNFIFSCGRSATKHFAEVFGDETTFVTHQLLNNTTPTRELIADIYRPAIKHKSFAYLESHVVKELIPFMVRNLKTTGRRQYFYTGHVPFTFGIADYLLKHLQAPIKILRIRRERTSHALSLMSMGPEEEDPWIDSSNVSSYRKRWLLSPTDTLVKLPISPLVWYRLNRFQRYLWVVDDTECRWQYLKRQYSFPFMEVQLESLDQIHGVLEYEEISKFLGIGFQNKTRKLFRRHNSMEERGHKPLYSVGDENLRKWNEEYKQAITSCSLQQDTPVGWNR